MKDLRLEKYGFRVRTRNGATVDRVLIHAESDEEARAKLLKMYPYCEVLAAWVDMPTAHIAGNSFEDVADLLSR